MDYKEVLGDKWRWVGACGCYSGINYYEYVAYRALRLQVSVTYKKFDLVGKYDKETIARYGLPLASLPTTLTQYSL